MQPTRIQMRCWFQPRHSDGSQRRGAMIVFISALIVVLLAMTLFTVDVAYMQLTRSELRAATDAASKAGAEALRRTRNENKARQAAIDMAAGNVVGGNPLLLRSQDVELGRSTLQTDGSWEFQPNEKPYTSVRVTGLLGGDSRNAPVNLFFADVFGSGTFEPTRSATAASTETEICLVLDRSHSMCYDLSGIEGKYPSSGRGLAALLPPDPKLSRWAALRRAMKVFFEVVRRQEPMPRISLVTWSSDVTREVPLSLNWGLLQKALDFRSANPMPGRTNLAAGLDEGVKVLTGPDVNPLAAKVIVLMTDGQWNQGRHPVAAAEDARDAGITVHAVTLLPAARQPEMDEIAEITGGRRYHADSEQELIRIFEEIACMLPVVLVE
jgi:Ca-activated chloride channel family protein